MVWWPDHARVASQPLQLREARKIQCKVQTRTCGYMLSEIQTKEPSERQYGWVRRPRIRIYRQWIAALYGPGVALSCDPVFLGGGVQTNNAGELAAIGNRILLLIAKNQGFHNRVHRAQGGKVVFHAQPLSAGNSSTSIHSPDSQTLESKGHVLPFKEFSLALIQFVSN